MKIDTSRLQHKFLLLILLLVLPWLGASVYSSFVERQAIVREEQAHGIEFLSYFESAGRTRLGNLLGGLEAMLEEVDWEDDMVPQKLTSVLKRMAMSTGDQVNMMVTDSVGNIVSSSLSDIEPLTISEREHVLNTLHTGRLSFGPYRSAHDDKPGLLVAYPVMSRDLGITASIVALIDEAWLMAPFERYDLPENVGFELVDTDWNVVASHLSSSKAVGISAAPDLSDLRERLLANLNGVKSLFHKWSDGSKRLVALKTITDSYGKPAFYATITMPAGSMLASATSAAFLDVVLMAIIAAAIIPIAWSLIKKQVLDPVDRLVNLTKRLGCGEMCVRHGGPYGRGDMGTLARAFDAMADALEQRTDELAHLSYHDDLTGAYNRTYLETLWTELDSKDVLPTTIILADINGLKIVNDTYGHQVGNELIATVGRIIQECVGDRGIVARWGGDEFVIVLANTDRSEGLRLCGQIQSVCEAVPKDPVSPSLAMGVATRTTHNLDYGDVLVEAESRMYRNKFIDPTSGRGRLMYSLRKALAEKTHETEEHSNRMSFLSQALGEKLGLHRALLDDLALLSVLHDIGKIGIPDWILNKPGPLSAEEWEVMKTHPEIGARIVEGSHELGHIAQSILTHHERWDGSGYPNGLKGAEIPLISRILAITDAYDAMISDRPYRAGMSVEDALEEIRRCAGMQFDPYLASVFVSMMEGTDGPMVDRG